MSRMTSLFHRTAGTLVALTLLGTVTACCGPQPISSEAGFQQIDSPAVAFVMMREAVQLEGPHAEEAPRIFYYLLSRDVRAEFPFWQVQQFWGRIQRQLSIDVGRSRLLRIEYLDESPFPPRPAARVVVEYPHPEEPGTIVESFLMLLEIETETYPETMPQWRLLYPYEPYQRAQARMWFRHIEDMEEDEPEGAPED